MSLYRSSFAIFKIFTAGTMVDGEPVRLYICTAWTAALLTTVFFQPTEHNVRTENILVRKFFHALAVLMFVPALVLEVRCV